MNRLDDNYKLYYGFYVSDFMIYKNIIDDIDSKIERGITEFDEEELKIFDIMEEYLHCFKDDEE